MPQNPSGTLPQATGEAHMPPLQERPHKFVPDSNWKLITRKTIPDSNLTLITRKTGQNFDLSGAQAQVESLGGELVELTDLDEELGAENVQEVLGNYLTEEAVAVHNLILTDTGLTGGEVPEIMEAAEVIEADPPMMLTAEATHLPMDTGLPYVSLQHSNHS